MVATMSKPIIFESTETAFSTYGLGTLSDCVSCKVTEERNGIFEAEIEYPITGIHYSEIALRRIIYLRPNYFDAKQPFRIYSISKPLNGIVTVSAQHISYDLSGYACMPFKATTISDAFEKLISNSVTSCPFRLVTSRTTQANFELKVPSSIRSCMGGSDGSILDVYGGEYHFDGFTVHLDNARGEDRGVVIRYGKNLTDIKQDENCSNVYTGVIGYYQNSSDGTVVKSDLQSVSGTFNYTRILTVDLSQEFTSDSGSTESSAPTVAQLNAKTQAYIKANNIGIPKVNLTVSFIQNDNQDEVIYWTDNEDNVLTDNEGNQLVQILHGVNTAVNLCDTVTIWFEKLGVQAKAECIKTVWNVLLDCYDSVEFGDAKSSLSSTINDIQKAQEESPTASFIDDAIKHQTEIIKGGTGGHFLIGTNDAGQPNETYWMDTADKVTAKKVLRANYQGIGFSSTGVDGTYTTAWTIDGHFNADFITTGTIKSIEIDAGNGAFHVDSSGALTATNATIKGTITGSVINGGSVNGTTITGGSISGTTISGTTINGGSVNGTTITGGTITGGTIAGASFIFSNGTYSITEKPYAFTSPIDSSVYGVAFSGSGSILFEPEHYLVNAKQVVQLVAYKTSSSYGSIFTLSSGTISMTNKYAAIAINGATVSISSVQTLGTNIGHIDLYSVGNINLTASNWMYLSSTAGIDIGGQSNVQTNIYGSNKKSGITFYAGCAYLIVQGTKKGLYFDNGYVKYYV
jgi:phage minor structural protein